MKMTLRALALLAVGVCAFAAPPDPTIVDTEELAWDVGPADGITLKRFIGDLVGMNLVRWAEGTSREPHTHVNEQIMLIQSGSYRITVEGVAHTLHAGELIIVSSYALHGIEALEDSEHIAIYSPAAFGSQAN
jgi:quercetin dioxygenase-like cupin family protein